MPDIGPLLDEIKTEAAAVREDDVVMPDYPSAEAAETTPLYHNARSEAEQEDGLGQPSGHHGQVEAEVEVEDGAHSPSRQPGVHPSITSAVELQLAAQLGQGLSQGVPTMLDPNDDANLRRTLAQHTAGDPEPQQSDHQQQQSHLQQQHHNQPSQDELPPHHDELPQHELPQHELPQHSHQLPSDELRQTDDQLPQKELQQHQDSLSGDGLQQHHDQLPQDELQQAGHQLPTDGLPRTSDPLHHEPIPRDEMHDNPEAQHLQHNGQPLNHDESVSHGQAISHGHAMSHGQAMSHHRPLLPESHDQQAQPPYIPDQAQHPQHQPPQQVQHQQHVTPQQPQHHQQQPQQPQHGLLSQGSMNHIGQLYAAHAQAVNDSTPPRKRSKVSRACDECRRKKVKCDASSESGDEPCSNCRRSSIRCLFSRIPQKRGPSKGYIKELADRIHHIEGRLASDNADGLSDLLTGTRREPDVFATPGSSDENVRKRPYSSISGADFEASPASRQATWSSEPRPIQPYAGGLKGAPYSVDSLAPRPLTPPPPEGIEADPLPRPAAAMDPEPIELDDPVREVDTDAFTGYLSMVHPCFPILAGTKSHVDAQLARCPRVLRDAFLEALYTSTQSLVSAPGLYTNGDNSSTAKMIYKWEYAPTSHTFVMDLVHLQTLILAAVATDNYGPHSLKGEHGIPSKTLLLAKAIGKANSMRLFCLKPPTEEESQQGLDETVAVRAWWSLVVLDRWNAIATATPLIIPNASAVVPPSLRLVLGDNVFYLLRLSKLMGCFAPLCATPSAALALGAGPVPYLNDSFNNLIEMFLEILPKSMTPSTHPIIHLVFWHCLLFAHLLQSNAHSTAFLAPCKESFWLMLANNELLTPLNHHFFCLTSLSLLQLAKVQETREEAVALLERMLEANLAPSTWDGVIRDYIREHLRPSTAQAAASQSLQHLADLATASEADAAKQEKNAHVVPPERVAFDPRSLIRNGYLRVMVESLPTDVMEE
ncbi:hypothetical protein GGR56DRAFT_665309 [Xylariaceae sp. FL0804]|nr:hypothetical protein GGR56DRAFT_665309 [Xylariaceae sp. FL0804]